MSLPAEPTKHRVPEVSSQVTHPKEVVPLATKNKFLSPKLARAEGPPPLNPIGCLLSTLVVGRPSTSQGDFMIAFMQKP